MSFQAYLTNIKAKTGKAPDDFHEDASKSGILTPSLTATQFTDWLKAEYGLGHGHAMAIYAVFKNEGWVQAKGRQ
jgi:hypothetical protein